MKNSKGNALRLLVYIYCVYFKVALVTCTTVFQEENNNNDELWRSEDVDRPFDVPIFDLPNAEFQPQTKPQESDTNFEFGTDTVVLGDHSNSIPVLDVNLNPSIPGGADQCRVLDDVSVNCSHLRLRGVPSKEFPKGIQSYDLSRNSISSLLAHAFSRYTSLKELDLQENNIYAIDPLAFIGLSNLEMLNLYKNRLVMNITTLRRAFSEDVFMPLKKLKKLWLQGNNPQPNNKNLHYPHRALSHLSSLEELRLDGFTNAVFESGFANLTRLETLFLDGYKHGHCELMGLRNDTFKYLTQIKNLSLTDCRLQGHRLEAGAFLPLKQLVQLNISQNQDINVQFFDRVFYGLQNTTSLIRLHMQFVVNLYTLGVCLSSKYIKYFPQSIEYLSARENKFQCIDRNVMDIIGKSLKVLDISKNNFVFGTYLLDLPKLKHLEALYMDDYQFIANKLPHIYPFNPHTPPLETDNCSLYASDSDELESEEFILRLPPNLTFASIQYAGMRYIISQLAVDSNNSLESLIIEGNYIPILEGPVHGLHSLKDWCLQANKIFRISDEFFANFSSLEKLNLSSNRLGDFFEENTHTRVFQPLVELKILDLSSNTIRVLGKTLFRGIDKLEVLKISHNPIYRFHPDLSSMFRLQAFVAEDTSLSYLSKKTRDAFDRRVQNCSSFYVDLQRTPIFCNCPNFAFLRWMVTSKAITFKNNVYYCRYPDTSTIRIHDDYEQTLEILSRQCSSHALLFLAVGASTILILLLIMFAMVYRYRWKLRYMYHAAYIYLRPDRQPGSDDSFRHDVFACYAEEDRHFVMDLLYPALQARGLSVFVHHRDFTAGELIGSNIVRAVRTCRRTVVVLTRTFARSYWCNYELQMANRESAHRGTPILIFLLLDEIADHEMGTDLLYNIQNNTYIEFPSHPGRDEGSLNKLWDKLARDVRG